MEAYAEDERSVAALLTNMNNWIIHPIHPPEPQHPALVADPLEEDEQSVEIPQVPAQNITTNLVRDVAWECKDSDKEARLAMQKRLPTTSGASRSQKSVVWPAVATT